MTKYTREQINTILNLEGWLKTQIDVFNLYAVLTIGVTNNTRGPGDSWEITQKTYSEKALDIKLEDFACFVWTTSQACKVKLTNRLF